MILIRGKEGIIHVIGKDIQNVFQNIFKQRGKWRREVKKYVSQDYTANATRAKNKEKMVIFMVDGKMNHGGLADRLRGIVTTYSVAKAMGIDFKINFVHPFHLDTFLEPANVDWRISQDEISYNSNDSLPIFCGCNGTHVEGGFQRLWFKQNFRKDYKQIHVYSNVHFAKDKFKMMFDDLFKPSDLLQKSIDKFVNEIGSTFITVTCRFQQLLGDFKEGNYKILPDTERLRLMNLCVHEIEKIHNDYNDTLIVVTSDSVSFLDYATKQLGYTRRIPGNVIHMDYNASNDVNLHLKSFVDLMVISKAERVFLLENKDMYNSGFPRIGALIGGKPFQLIRFDY